MQLPKQPDCYMEEKPSKALLFIRNLQNKQEYGGSSPPWLLKNKSKETKLKPVWVSFVFSKLIPTKYLRFNFFSLKLNLFFKFAIQSVKQIIQSFHLKLLRSVKQGSWKLNRVSNLLSNYKWKKLFIYQFWFQL
jgi:hypothetical protein